MKVQTFGLCLLRMARAGGGGGALSEQDGQGRGGGGGLSEQQVCAAGRLSRGPAVSSPHRAHGTLRLWALGCVHV